MGNPKCAPSNYRTYGRSRAVRLEGFDYSSDLPIHLTLSTEKSVFLNPDLAQLVCDSIEACSCKTNYRLFGYCLMPDHLHVLLSPVACGKPIDDWLRDFKSYTTNRFMRMGGSPPLWQRSAHDHICRGTETAETVLIYIANNPVRHGLVDDWRKWPWTKMFIEL